MTKQEVPVVNIVSAMNSVGLPQPLPPCNLEMIILTRCSGVILRMVMKTIYLKNTEHWCYYSAPDLMAPRVNISEGHFP